MGKNQAYFETENACLELERPNGDQISISEL